MPDAPDTQAVYDSVRILGGRRRRAQALADSYLDAIVANVVASMRAGTKLNLSRVAADAGISKRTLYARLPGDLIDRRTR